jgi:rhomboid protease GluP
LAKVEVRAYGGTTFDDIMNFELWRLFSSQMVHVKMPHMLYNALCLLLVGSVVERRIGSIRTVLIWLLAGGSATVVSPILIEAPWNVATGASQATFAFSGCALVFVFASSCERLWVACLIALVLVPGVALDFFMLAI